MGNVPLSYLKLSDGKHAFLFTTFVDSFEIYYRSEKYAVASYGGDVVNGSDWQLYFGINPVDISYACIQKDFINSSGAVAYILQEVYGKGSNGEYFRGYIEI